MELVTSALAKSMAGWNSSRPHAVFAQFKQYCAPGRMELVTSDLAKSMAGLYQKIH